MKKVYFFALVVVVGFCGSCKLDAPIYPGQKGYVADTPPNQSTGTGSGSTGTGTGSTGTGSGSTGTGTGSTGTGTGGTGTVTPVANGNGLPLGAVGTILYKVDGITYTCTSFAQFGIDQQANVYIAGEDINNEGPWVCVINLNFTGNKVGTYPITAPFNITGSSNNNNTLSLIDGKVAITSINTDGYFGTLQGTFNANMQDDNGKIYNVIGSFNFKQ
jgi:hypothetical protein